MEMNYKRFFVWIMFATIVFFSLNSPGQEDIAGMQRLSAWYRADKVERDGGRKLKVLNDCSGKGLNVISGAQAPVIIDSAVNGRPVLRFAGTESPLINDKYDWSKNGFTAFVIAACADGPGKPAFHINHRNITTPGKAFISDGGRAGLALGVNWNGRPGVAGGNQQHAPVFSDFAPPYDNDRASDLLIDPGKFYLFAYMSAEGKQNKTATSQKSVLDVSVYVDGSAASTVLHPTVSMEKKFGGNGFQIAAAGTGERFKGDIAEIIMFDGELPDAGIKQVFRYLGNKYNLHETVKYLPADPVVFTPAFDNSIFWFPDTVTVEMNSKTVNSEIRYTTDGSVPEKTSLLYTAPVKLAATTVINARTFASQREPSPVNTAKFIKIQTIKPTANKLSGGWKYSWGDEFNGPEVDEKVWGYELGYVRNAEAQFYTKRKENSRIDNGNLLIQGLYDNWEGHKYTSASRSTENKVTLTYGRYELRAKIDVRSGSWPAWWLWSRPDKAGWPKEGEIDMMEYTLGKLNFNVMDGAKRWYHGNKKKSIASLGGVEWAKAFHVWTMDWDAEKIKLYLDGQLVVDYPVSSADGSGLNGVNPFRTPETKKIVINQALGGTCGGPLNPKDAPFELRVDWMRVHTWSQEPAYTLTVNAGSGSGPYVIGTRASVTANMPPAGYVFGKWIGNASVADPGIPSTTIIMPASDVTITAIYKKK